jgi:hypothetical protein
MTDYPNEITPKKIDHRDQQDSLYDRVTAEATAGQPATTGPQASDKPEVGRYGVKNLGAIEELSTPADFKLSRKVDRATGYVYTWSPDAHPNLTFTVSSRSQALNDSHANAFKTLLQKEPETDVSGEIQGNPALQGALRERADKNAFTVTSAAIREIEGRRVLSLTGTYKANGFDTEMILVDQNGDGKFIQEIAYTGPKPAGPTSPSPYRRYGDAAGKSLDSLNLK